MWGPDWPSGGSWLQGPRRPTGRPHWLFDTQLSSIPLLSWLCRPRLLLTACGASSLQRSVIAEESACVKSKRMCKIKDLLYPRKKHFGFKLANIWTKNMTNVSQFNNRLCCEYWIWSLKGRQKWKYCHFLLNADSTLFFSLWNSVRNWGFTAAYIIGSLRDVIQETDTDRISTSWMIFIWKKNKREVKK